ncbi:MAG: phospholipase A [Bdellovibrio sp.]
MLRRWGLVAVMALTGWGGSRAQAYPNENETTTWQVQGYKPNYFLLSDDDAKLNVSFKMPLLEGQGLYLGYSQIMLWRIYEDSSPFEDVNYNPEIFYRVLIPDQRLTWVDVGIYEHESNGQSGENSRGWNRFYLLYSTEAVSFDEAKIFWSLKGWVPYSVEDTNERLVEYRGHYEGSVTLASFLGPYFERSDLTLRFFAGGHAGMDPTQGGQEVTLRLKGPVTKIFLPVLTLQLYHGYAESLLNYDQKKTEFRVGIGF